MKLVKRLAEIFWELVETATFALGFTVATYLFLFQTTQVHGFSSYPTIQPDEMLIVDKITYRFSSPQRGDFVILQSPRNADIDFIKRIIGLPGETLKISEGNVFINGSLLDESGYLPPGTFTGPEGFLKENQPIQIPSGYYFVMGDNRVNSSDSRDFGPIPSGNIVGKVDLRFWPPEKFGKVDNLPLE